MLDGRVDLFQDLAERKELIAVSLEALDQPSEAEDVDEGAIPIHIAVLWSRCRLSGWCDRPCPCSGANQ
jgi:hypothetical protein